MKKYLLTIAFVAAQISAIAQTVNVHFKNGQQIQYPASNVDYVDFSAKAADPTVSAGQVVDLGLSVYWASCNLGAEKPEEYGDYYAWGETKPKSSFSQSNYSYYDSNTSKYIEIGKIIEGTQYDAATVNLGSDWRIPTRTECQELVDNCTWEWTQTNGINGYKVTGKNGNSIFMPAAGLYGMYIYSPHQVNTNLYYWSATSQTSNPDDVECLWGPNNISNVKILVSAGIRPYYGITIRPVTKNLNAGGNPVDHSQDNLVTDKISASFIGGAYSSINGVIQSGSVLNTQFTNGSSESVTLVAIQIFDSGSSNVGNNVLESEVEVAAGESKSYGLKLGTNMTTPVVRFTYRYNKKNYTAEATWTTPSSPF